jgi:hypothetical protein
MRPDPEIAGLSRSLNAAITLPSAESDLLIFLEAQIIKQKVINYV